MTPEELLRRFEVLANAASPIETVIIAPLLPRDAANLIADLNSSEFATDPQEYEGQVTAQDLRDFLKWVRKHESAS